MSTPPPIPKPGPPPLRESWWSGNWKWFVPVAVLGMMCFVAFMAGISWLVFGAMKSSDAYKMTVARVHSDPRVIDALGTPIHEDNFMGNVATHNDSGAANFVILVSGPKGGGHVEAAAIKSQGVWTFMRLEVKLGGSGKSIDLLTPEEQKSTKAQ